jgi:hypothetical protein
MIVLLRSIFLYIMILIKIMIIFSTAEEMRHYISVRELTKGWHHKGSSFRPILLSLLIPTPFVDLSFT